MIDLYLDPLTNDIQLDDTMNWRMVEGDDLIAQKLKQRLSTQKGEWIFNINKGVDYLGQILVKDPDLSVVRAELLEAILDDDDGEIAKVLVFELDTDARTLTVAFRVATEDDAIEMAGAEQGTDFVWFQL